VLFLTTEYVYFGMFIVILYYFCSILLYFFLIEAYYIHWNNDNHLYQTMCVNFAQFGVNKYIFTIFFFSFNSVQRDFDGYTLIDRSYF